MSLSQDELDDFHRFAGHELAQGEAESLAKLVSKWEARREREQTIADIRESLDDYAAGRSKPADEAFAAVRKKLGLNG